MQNSDVLHFNKRAFLTHSLPSDQGGDMRCEVWHQQEWTVTPKSTARRRTLPPNSFVNRLSQYGLICVQLLSLLSTRQHTEDSVWLDVWPLTALSVRLLGKCIKHRGETIFFSVFIFFFFVSLLPVTVKPTSHLFERMKPNTTIMASKFSLYKWGLDWFNYTKW